MNFLRLRRTPKLAVPKHETDTFFVDADGVFKKMAPDGTVSEVGGGGGSMPVYESGYYEQSDGPTTIVDGSSAYLSFDDFAGGDDVLNIATPAHPLVRKAGLFVVTVEVSPTTNMTAGGMFSLELILDFSGEAIAMRSGAVADQGICVATNSWVMEAGAQFRLFCRNLDGASDRAFNINNATVSRIGPA